MPLAIDCWYLTGPTAVGKTRVALELARLLDAEIVSLDSMALYRGMDVGTAKPAAEDRAAVPHHLIDVIDPNEDFSLWDYVDAARTAIAGIRSHGREVLFAGGTPLYLKAMLRGIFQGPPADWGFRRRMHQEAEQAGSAALHRRLAEIDPRSAARLHPNDVRRIVRALEVYEQTGRPISELQTQFAAGRPAGRCKVFVLDRPRRQLHRRIDRRVDRMFAGGLVEEVRRLLARYESLGRTASQAVGYREVIDHLAGRFPLAETIERVKFRTHRLARRQATWFRSLSECRTVEPAEGADPKETAERIVALAKESPGLEKRPRPNGAAAGEG